MIILGLNYYFHDSSACVIIDGDLKVAIEEERLSRHKHTPAFPEKSAARCMEVCGFSFNDITHLAISVKPSEKSASKIRYGLRHIRNAKPFIRHELINGLSKQSKFWRWVRTHWPDKKSRPEIHFIEHHLAHIGGAYFVSPFNYAALLSLDGSGEWATDWIGIGEHNSLKKFGQNYFPNSLGSFYEATTEFCGFRPNYDEGKTMGLAPFGNPEKYYDQMAKIVTLGKKWNYSIDLSFFNYQFWGHHRCSTKFYRTFGSPRENRKEIERHHMDVAAACQRILEDRVLEICRRLKRKTNAENLVVSGGVFLNSVMIGRIERESEFQNIYVTPASGDGGTAIGAAYYLYNGIKNRPRRFIFSNPYVGTEYSNNEIENIIKYAKLRASRHDDITSIGARLLHSGKILGWFQGKMELGARALGNRSILANPTQDGMKEKINAEVKHRESFRPFAPVIPQERKSEYFDTKSNVPFMEKVFDVLPEKRENVPAITHVDGSARLQTIDKALNPLLHDLIEKFSQLSGVPVILNTSFNVMGEPIVESPIDAIRCFWSTGLDSLIIGNYLLEKE